MRVRIEKMLEKKGVNIILVIGDQILSCCIIHKTYVVLPHLQ
jgi:hypothetical protein